MFRAIDLDGSGTLELNELESFMIANSASVQINSQEMKSQVEVVWGNMDKNSKHVKVYFFDNTLCIISLVAWAENKSLVESEFIDFMMSWTEAAPPAKKARARHLDSPTRLQQRVEASQQVLSGPHRDLRLTSGEAPTSLNDIFDYAKVPIDSTPSLPPQFLVTGHRLVGARPQVPRTCEG